MSPTGWPQTTWTLPRCPSAKGVIKRTPALDRGLNQQLVNPLCQSYGSFLTKKLSSVKLEHPIFRTPDLLPSHNHDPKSLQWDVPRVPRMLRSRTQKSIHISEYHQAETTERKLRSRDHPRSQRTLVSLAVREGHQCWPYQSHGTLARYPNWVGGNK